MLEVARVAPERPAERPESLTDQERRIPEFIAGGPTNREIAGRMFLATRRLGIEGGHHAG